MVHIGAPRGPRCWDPPANDGGADIYAYVLRYSKASGGPHTEVMVTPRPTEMDVLRICHGGTGCTNPRSTTLSGLTSGTRYTISVAAINANGRGAFTAMAWGAAPD